MCTTRKNISALRKLFRDRGELRLEAHLTSPKLSANVSYAAVCVLCTRKLSPLEAQEIHRIADVEVDDLARLLGKAKFNRLREEAAKVLERAADHGRTMGMVEAFLLAEATLLARKGKRV